MAGLVTNQGLVVEMTPIAALSAGWVVHLYQNNYTPTAGDSTINYTEATYDAYAAQPTAAWTLSAPVSGDERITSPPLTFLDGGAVTPNLIYGYYVTGGANLIMAERFAGGPYNFNALGVGIRLTIQQDMTAP